MRKAQAEETRARVQRAVAELFDSGGGAESITFKAVAERAGVTEMTVYRHFPSRQELLQGLWEYLNRQMGPQIDMPAGIAQLREQHRSLYAGFDRIPTQITASIGTPQGREMRRALNKKRRKAFLAIAEEVARGLPAAKRLHVAAVLQLLHSAYAWDSLREQWGLSGEEAGEATLWAIDALIASLSANTAARNSPTNGELRS